jgi:hypothetical protein
MLAGQLDIFVPRASELESNSTATVRCVAEMTRKRAAFTLCIKRNTYNLNKLSCLSFV